MGKFFDAEGNEHEAFTKEELEAERQKAIDEYKAEAPEAKELETTKTALETAQAELAKLKEAGGNNSEQRKIIEDKEQEIKKLQETFEKQISDIKTYVDNKDVEAAIKKLVGNDAELAKKVREHLKTSVSSMPQETEEQRLNKVLAAYKLSTNEPVPDAVQQVFASGGANGGANGGEPDPNKPSPALMEFGKKYFNITEEDWKKYGGKKYEIWSPES